MYKKAKSKLN